MKSYSKRYIVSQEELAKNLRMIREHNNLTQAAVAAFLELERSTYAYYESLKTLPNIFILIKLAKFYGIDIKCFILLDGWIDAYWAVYIKLDISLSYNICIRT